jgi:hypothetical protein
MSHIYDMTVLALVALLVAPAHAGVSLLWAPALDQALVGLQGPGRDVAQGFDGEALKGLGVRVNEISVLSKFGVSDLDALRRFRRRPDAAAGLPLEHLAALERSLRIFLPVIARLEPGGVRLDERAVSAAPLGPLVSLALADEAAEIDRKALTLASRYGDARLTLEQALADSEEADALLRDRYPYLSPDLLDRLARVYDSGRTKALAARLARTRPVEVAIATSEDRASMRDAVAEPPAESIFRRAADALGALAARWRAFVASQTGNWYHNGDIPVFGGSDEASRSPAAAARAPRRLRHDGQI